MGSGAAAEPGPGESWYGVARGCDPFRSVTGKLRSARLQLVDLDRVTSAFHRHEKSISLEVSRLLLLYRASPAFRSYRMAPQKLWCSHPSPESDIYSHAGSRRLSTLPSLPLLCFSIRTDLGRRLLHDSLWDQYNIDSPPAPELDNCSCPLREHEFLAFCFSFQPQASSELVSLSHSDLAPPIPIPTSTPNEPYLL